MENEGSFLLRFVLVECSTTATNRRSLRKLVFFRGLQPLAMKMGARQNVFTCVKCMKFSIVPLEKCGLPPWNTKFRMAVVRNQKSR